MNVAHIISEALIEYDTAKPVIRFLQKNAYYEGLKSPSDTVRTKFTFIDRATDEKILETEVETLAIYYDKLNVFSWSWSQIGLTSAENYLSKEVLLYALKLDPELSYLKSLLTTSRGVIKDPIQLDINLAVAASVIKQNYIYPYVHKLGDYKLIYYLILLNKKDLDKLKNKISPESDNYNME